MKIPFELPHGEGWMVREHPSTEGLRPCPVETPSRLKPFPIRWHRGAPERPGWEQSWDIADMSAINESEEASSRFFELPHHCRTKVGGFPTEIQHHVANSDDYIFQIGSEEKPKSTPGTHRFSICGPSISVTGYFTIRVAESFVHPVFAPRELDVGGQRGDICARWVRFMVLCMPILLTFQNLRRFLALILLLVLCACDSTHTKPADKAATQYPARWWEPVSKEGAPAWEIFPQEAGPGEVILSKRNELGLLSNFAPTPFTFHGKRYASLEGFWQMMKYPEGSDDPRATFPGLTWAHTREEVARLTSFDAKRAGDAAERNMKAMGITWVTFEGKRMEYRPEQPGEHYRLIVEATREKVRQNPEVQKVLLATGDLVLKPDHHQETNAPAAWRYYEILMQIRGELRKGR